MNKQGELVNILQPLIRRVVREELERVIKNKSGIFYLEPDMPLHEDMETVLRRKKEGKIKVYSHQEVWGE